MRVRVGFKRREGGEGGREGRREGIVLAGNGKEKMALVQSYRLFVRRGERKKRGRDGRKRSKEGEKKIRGASSSGTGAAAAAAAYKL